MDDLIFAEEESDQINKDTWKVLIVDDDEETHRVTKFALNGYSYGGKTLEFYDAYSGTDAIALLKDHDDIAVVLLDVVMEMYDSGLQLVKFIRDEIKNDLVRIILRTGQPGHAPEYEVIKNYDINDYKNKTELTETKLFTTVTTALRSYSHLLMIEEYNADLEEKVDNRTQELREKNDELEKTLIRLGDEQKKARELLLNILPGEIAERMTRGEQTIVDHFEEVTVLFADIVNFTGISRRNKVDDTVNILNTIFSYFDHTSEELGLEKIKTIGDCYMVVGGLPATNGNHLKRMATLGLRFIEQLPKISEELGEDIHLRIGLHTGNVVAGVIGKRKFIYDLWGDTVNIASRMEMHGAKDKIHCTQAVYEQLMYDFEFQHNGKIEVKGVGEYDSYYLVK